MQFVREHSNALVMALAALFILMGATGVIGGYLKSMPKKDRLKSKTLGMLFMLSAIVMIAFLMTMGCATAPHPLLRALAPSNIGTHIRQSVGLDITAEMSVKHFPYLTDSFVRLHTRSADNMTVITVRPPFNTDEFLPIYRHELEKRGHKNFILEKE